MATNDFLLIIRNRGQTTRLKRIEAINYVQALNKACSLYPNKFINYKHIIRTMDLQNAIKEAIDKSNRSAHKQHIILLDGGEFEVENDISLTKDMDVYSTYHKGVKVETKVVKAAAPTMESGTIKKEVKEVKTKTIKNNPIMKTEKTSTIQKMSAAVKKQANKAPAKKAAAKKAAPAKKAAKKATGTPGKSLPVAAIVEFVKVKARTFLEVRAMLKKAGKMESTIKAQLGRMKNSPLLKVEGETVKYKK